MAVSRRVRLRLEGAVFNLFDFSFARQQVLRVGKCSVVAKYEVSLRVVVGPYKRARSVVGLHRTPGSAMWWSLRTPSVIRSRLDFCWETEAQVEQHFWVGSCKYGVSRRSSV